MTSISVIGYGNNVVKNVLPAISRSPQLQLKRILVRDKPKYNGEAHFQYMSELSISRDVIDSEWVYISTPISTHYELAKSCLSLGINVICEKPLTTSVSEITELFALASKFNVKLHEVCVYQYHKQFREIKKLLKENKSEIKKIHSTFKIPHLNRENIRYRSDLYGGAFWDVGYYPLSFFLSLFDVPERYECIISGEAGFDVDLSGIALLEYENFLGISEWGIGRRYENIVVIETKNELLRVQRAFSKPHDLETSISICNGNIENSISVTKDDQFRIMIESIVQNEVSRSNNEVHTLIEFMSTLYSDRYLNRKD